MTQEYILAPSTDETKKDDNKLSPELLALRYDLLKSCVSRIDNLGYRGKEKNRAALDYLIGATRWMELTGHPLMQNMVACLCFIFAPRGAYDEAVAMIREYHDSNPGMG